MNQLKDISRDAPSEDRIPDARRSPLTRIAESRWQILLGAGLAGLATLVYDVPALVSTSAVALQVAIAGLVPQKAQARRVQAVKQRQLRRMWPGTGMKLTVDALPNPCFVADGRGITRYVNKAAGELYGLVKPGDPLSFYLRAPALLEAFDRVCRDKRAVQITWVEKVPTEAWFEAHLAPIFMPGAGEGAVTSSPDFVLVVIQNQTEQRRLERMRTDFVANASHELRTPLASLTGFIETLQGPARDDAKARETFLKIMLEQAGRMRRLIDDILSLSRIELKAHVRPVEKVNLVEIVRHSADALAPLARDLDLAINVEAPDAAALVRGDRDELIQVTENLLENALKYGSSGGRVDLSVTRDASGRGHVLQVRDYGEGIAAEHLPRLTERFYRVDVASSRSMKGTGLGLAIVKHILTRHRARLDIVSEQGKGATFRVAFPPADALLKPDAAEAAAAEI
ncbi:ATP-binding protein [Roseibium aestuarii]|uniref:histidine kinase n=1 Tax=Roseibium aestuarii TaxID=2600299 RepID=A0ABW4JUG6_9HYPH|nr:ATP-binding protein [Roseibium aestuarii]